MAISVSTLAALRSTLAVSSLLVVAVPLSAANPLSVARLLGCLGRGQFDRDGRAIFPQAFERVVKPVFLVEDVRDDVAEVEEDPAALSPTFAAQGLRPGLEHLLFDLTSDGLDVALVAPRRKKEDIGQREGAGYVESDEIFTLLSIGGTSRNGEKFAGARSGSHMILRGREVSKGEKSENVEGKSRHQQSGNDDSERRRSNEQAGEGPRAFGLLGVSDPMG